MISRRILACCLLALAPVGCDTVLQFESDSAGTGDASVPSDARTPPPKDAQPASASDARCDGGGGGTTDACGSCEQSCLGGDCEAGVCQPVVLASLQGSALGAEVRGIDGGLPAGLEGPGRIATDGTFVYWLNLRGQVMRVPVGGGTPFQVAATAGSPVWIELDSTYVYFMSAATGTIFRVLQTGGVPAELTPTPPTGGVGNEFLIYAGDLYWADTVGDYMCPVQGCGGAAKNLWAEGNEALLESDGYSESPYSMTVQTPAFTFISEVASSGQADIAIAIAGETCINVPSSDRYVELHSDASQLYALSSQTVLSAAAMSCGPPTYLASGMQGPPHALALDDGFVYWVNTGLGTANNLPFAPNTIQRCAKTGCSSPETLATEPSTANGLAVDGVAIYWTTGDGKVKRLAKPAASAP